MGSSEGWEQTHASATGQSNMQFAAETPIAVIVIGVCPITRIFVARQPSREGRRRPHRRRTREWLCPRPNSAGASSAVLDSQLQASLEAAGMDIGRADAIGPRWPYHSLFIYSYVRKRAVLSARIERPRLLPTLWFLSVRRSQTSRSMT